MRVGLSGYGDIPTGLGQLNARLWRNLPFDVRGVTEHRRLGGVGLVPSKNGSVVSYGEPITDWMLRGDTLVFVERPMPDGICEIAKQRGIRVVCIPMPEWTPAWLPWLPHVDLFIAFTDQCFDHCEKICLGSRTVRLQCPLDLDEFPFRERTEARSIAYLDGWGGVHQRKGWLTVQELLRWHPDSVRVKSQRVLRGSEPASDRPADLYADVDVVLMPARFDGLGLTVLEAMASGCVVLATDCAPYSEFLGNAYDDPGLLIPVASTSAISIHNGPWTANNVTADTTWDRLQSLKQRDDVGVLSRAGRAYIEREHGDAAWQKLWGMICV